MADPQPPKEESTYPFLRCALNQANVLSSVAKVPVPHFMTMGASLDQDITILVQGSGHS